MRDLLAVVESAYRLDLSETECLQELATRAAALATRRPLFAFSSVLKRTACMEAFRGHQGGQGYENVARAIERAIPRRQLEAMAYARPPALESLSELAGFADARAVPEAHAVGDVLCLDCPTGEGHMLVVAAVYLHPRAVSAIERARWAPVAAHLACAWRIRKRLLAATPWEPSVDAVFDAGGRCQFARGRARSRFALGHLRGAVAHRARVLGGRGVRDCPQDFWSELIAGGWTLLAGLPGSDARAVYAVRNDSVAAPLRALSLRECDVLRRARRGASNKQIAMDLCVSEATVSRLVRSVGRKLGLPGAFELARFPGDDPEIAMTPYQLGPDQLLVLDVPRAAVGRISGLTPAERQVLADMLRGHSAREISVRRGCSRRTVENQMASVFAKLRVHSRRELARALSA